MSNEELFNDHGWILKLESATAPNGAVKKTVRAYRPDSVHILAFDDESRVLMIREFRPFYGEYLWMLPSGRVDKETDVRVAADRELREETGFRANSIVSYCSVNLTESIVMTNHIFIAHDLHSDPLPQDEDEVIEVHAMPLEEALQKVLTSPKIHVPSAFALLRYINEHRQK